MLLLKVLGKVRCVGYKGCVLWHSLFFSCLFFGPEKCGIQFGGERDVGV